MREIKSTLPASLALMVVVSALLLAVYAYENVVKALQADAYGVEAKQTAQELEQEGKYVEAEEWYRESDSRISLLLGEWPRLRIAGLHYMYFNDLDRASEILKSIVAENLSPNDQRAYHLLSQEVAFVNEQYEEAAEHAQAVIVSDGNRFDTLTAYEIRGLSLIALDRPAEAREVLDALTQFSEFGGGNWPIHRTKALCGSARIYAALGEVNEVRRLVDSQAPIGDEPWFIFMEPELDCLYARAVSEAEAGNIDVAKQHASQYLEVANNKLNELMSPLLSHDRRDVEKILGN